MTQINIDDKQLIIVFEDNQSTNSIANGQGSKRSKHKDIKKTVLVSHIDKLLDESYMNNFFGGHKKTHQKKSTVTKKIDSKRTERKRQTK